VRNGNLHFAPVFELSIGVLQTYKHEGNITYCAGLFAKPHIAGHTAAKLPSGSEAKEQRKRVRDGHSVVVWRDQREMDRIGRLDTS
jgi:hypothetical protein